MIGYTKCKSQALILKDFVLYNSVFYLHFELIVKNGPLVDIVYFFKRGCERVSSLFVIFSVSTINQSFL